MQELSLIIGFSGLVILLVNSLNYRNPQYGSDHHFHLNLVHLIKENGNRLVKRYRNILGSKTIAYPQLFHWIFSFFPMKKIARTIFVYKSVLYFLDVIFFFLFFYSDLVKFQSTMPLWKIFLYAALLFIFTPFNYVRWNASNAGLSPRSLGLLLGRLFVYTFLYFLQTHSPFALAGLVILAFLIFLASQFALQYMLFLCLIYAVSTGNLWIAAVPFAGFALFMLLSPELSLKFIRGQWQHKKTYATWFAKRFILKYRPSIWRDWVWDFWVRIRRDKWNAIPYIQHNALASVLWGFTILPAIFYHFFRTGRFDSWTVFTQTWAQEPLLQIILVTVLIFILTSFAFTRFLGEPERYLEFVKPLMVILFMQSFSSTIIYYTVIYYVVASFLMLLVNRWYNRRNPLTKNPIWVFSGNEQVQGILQQLHATHGELRILCSNEEIARMLLRPEYQFFIPDIASAKTGPFEYRDLFPKQYPMLNEALLSSLIENFRINVLIVSNSENETYSREGMETLMSSTGYTMYFIVQRD